MTKVTPEQIDAILPQTQCGLCTHGGCMPYAEALIYENAAIDLCPPGGVPVLRKIGALLQRDPAPFESAMQAKTKPPLAAIVREAECIGCTKCIQVCPVDAILGSAKQMHSVISAECTGCELCVPACPVDCIDMLPDTFDDKNPDIFRARFQSREKRLKNEKQHKLVKEREQTDTERKKYLEDVMKRINEKKAK